MTTETGAQPRELSPAPKTHVADFLAAYSRAGGTHHSALVYGDVCDELARFGRIMGWRVTELA